MSKSIVKVGINREEESQSPAQKKFNLVISLLEKEKLLYEKTANSLNDKSRITEQLFRPVLDRMAQGFISVFKEYKDALQKTRDKDKREVFARFILAEVDKLRDLPIALSETDSEWVEEMCADCDFLAFPYDDDDDYDDEGDDDEMDDDEVDDDFVDGMDEEPDSLNEILFKSMISQIEMQLAFSGIEIDLSELNSKMTPEEIENKVEELVEKAKEKYEGKKRSKKKSKRELEAEKLELQMEEAKKRNIGKILKDLAKLLHPDLVIDPVEKLKRNELMKELTIAYKSNDLLTLLKLEMEWVHSSSDRINLMAEAELMVYVQIFEEQLLEVRRKMAELPYRMEYSFIRLFCNSEWQLKRWNPKTELKKLEKQLESIEILLNNLKHSPTNKRKILNGMIREFEENEECEDDFFWGP